MAKIVVSDTDFLSSILKIRRLDLILIAFRTKSLSIPPAVAYELRRSILSDFLDSALTAHKIIIQAIGVHPIKGFGLGEIEAIALAEKTKGILLMDDRKASLYALTKGLTAITLPDFLLFCKTRFLNRKEILQIITQLRKEDHYLFSEENKKTLLA